MDSDSFEIKNNKLEVSVKSGCNVFAKYHVSLYN